MNTIKRGTLRLAALAGLSAALLSAAPAIGHAAAGEPVVTRNGATVVITAGSVTRDDSLTLQAVSGRLHVFGAVVAGTGCDRVSGNEVDCGAGVTTVEATLGAGRDRFSSLTAIAGTVDGGAGDDTFLAGRGPGTALAYRGGLGADTADYASSGTGVTVTKGDAASADGRPGLDRDDVGVDVEAVRGTVRADTLTGSTGADILIGGEGADTLSGRGGGDTLDARDAQGTRDAAVDCGTGADTAIADAADAPAGCETVNRP